MSNQDMPPPGGFSTINVERTLPKPLIRQGIFAAILVGMSLNGFRLLREKQHQVRVLRTEQTEHYIAVHPFLLAESERKFLMHLRNLREEERELMKDHAGWKLGTLYGEPVFKSLPKDSIPPISPSDWIAHNSFDEFQKRVVILDSHQ